MKAFCYTENIFGSLCAVGMRIMNSGGPAQNPLSIAPLISITGPIFVHVPSPLFDSCTFFAALLFFPLFFLFLFLATLQFAQCIHLALTLVVVERGGVPPSLVQRWASSFDISRYRFSCATASCLCEPKLDSIPNPDCFLLTRLNCPNECNRLCRCFMYILDPRSVPTYVKQRRH